MKIEFKNGDALYFCVWDELQISGFEAFILFGILIIKAD